MKGVCVFWFEGWYDRFVDWLWGLVLFENLMFVDCDELVFVVYEYGKKCFVLLLLICLNLMEELNVVIEY